jgi:hypothetical protein
MADTSKNVWVDLSSEAMAHLKKYQPTKKEDDVRMNQQSPSGAQGQKDGSDTACLAATGKIVRSNGRVAKVAAPKMPVLPNVPCPEELMRELIAALDYHYAEGLWDKLFGTVDDRLERSIGRGHALAQLKAVMVENVEQICRLAETWNDLQRQRYQAVLDALKYEHTRQEETQRLWAVAQDIAREERLKDAEAAEELACRRANAAGHEKRAQEALRQPPLPPPPAPPTREEELAWKVAEAKAEADIARHKAAARDARREPPPPVDEEARKRAEAKRERKLKYDIKLDEVEEQAEFESEKTKRGLERICEVFGNPHLDRATMRQRILELIDQYKLQPDVIPLGIQELLMEVYSHDA